MDFVVIYHTPYDFSGPLIDYFQRWRKLVQDPIGQHRLARALNNKTTTSVPVPDRRGKLKLQMRTHTGEKPYHCIQCDKTFSETGKLHVHMKTHNDEKSHQCSQYDQAFFP